MSSVVQAKLAWKQIFVIGLILMMMVDLYFILWSGGDPLHGLLNVVRATNKSNALNNHETSTVNSGPGQHLVTDPPPTTRAPCQPKHRIVFVKTHKTGSSTVTTMLERYGHARGLNFVLPRSSHVFSQFNKFTASNAYLYNLRDGNDSLVIPAIGGYQIFANHARYNRREQGALIPNAFYFTIIREPASQFESAFNFFRIGRYMPHRTMTDIFAMSPISFYTSTNSKPMGFMRNGQLYDLGLEQQSQNATSVDAKVEALSQEMDLVMIMEYFDESLLLLKKQLCWEFDDIIYISQLVRQAKVRNTITASLAKRIHRWNHADVKLYQRFNETLWEKIRSYGQSFQRDLATFRELKNVTTNRCLKNATMIFDIHKTGRFKLQENATEECKDLVRSDRSWVPILRRSLAQKTSSFIKRNNSSDNKLLR